MGNSGKAMNIDLSWHEQEDIARNVKEYGKGNGNLKNKIATLLDTEGNEDLEPFLNKLGIVKEDWGYLVHVAFDDGEPWELLRSQCSYK